MPSLSCLCHLFRFVELVMMVMIVMAKMMVMTVMMTWWWWWRWWARSWLCRAGGSGLMMGDLDGYHVDYPSASGSFSAKRDQSKSTWFSYYHCFSKRGETSDISTTLFVHFVLFFFPSWTPCGFCRFQQKLYWARKSVKLCVRLKRGQNRRQVPGGFPNLESC